MPQAPVRRQRVRPTAPSPARTDRATWTGAVEAFLGDGRRRNLTPATISTYRWVLAGERLNHFRRESRIDRPSKFDADAITRFELELVDAGLRPGSVSVFHRTLHTFLEYCRRAGIAVDDAVLSVGGPKQSIEEPDTFTVAEERRLIAAAKTERDKVLVEFMLRTGLRLSEVARVTVDDIVETPTGAYVRVRQGKGQKDRAVPLDTGTTKFSRTLARYVARSRPRDAAERTLFLTSRSASGKRGEYAALRPNAIQVVLQRLGEETGIHCNPHKFRHTFATRALAAGVDVMALQRALGHTTLAMVSRYIHFQKEDLLEAWQRRRD